MTDPNVLGGDQFGLKFIFGSDTKIVQLGRAAGLGGASDPHEFPSELLSLVEMNSGIEGSAYSVPVGKVFYMMAFITATEGSNDLSLSIQRNSTVDNDALGDNLWQCFIEGDTSTKNRMPIVVGGLQFNAGDYVTPYNLQSATPRWSFQCWGVECDA